MQNTVHLGCNICGRTRSFQLRGQHRHGALAYVGEDDTDVPLPDRLSAFQEPAAPPKCFQLNRRKLRLDMIGEERRAASVRLGQSLHCRRRTTRNLLTTN